jgi:hypothetical protein
VSELVRNQGALDLKAPRPWSVDYLMAVGAKEP